MGEKPLVLSTVSPILILSPIIRARMSQPFHRPPHRARVPERMAGLVAHVFPRVSDWQGGVVWQPPCHIACLLLFPRTMCDHRGPRFSFVAPVFKRCICACILSPRMRFIVVTKAARGGATPRRCLCPSSTPLLNLQPSFFVMPEKPNSCSW